MCDAANRDLPLFHCFKQSALDLSWGSIDFVGQNKIGKNLSSSSTVDELLVWTEKDHYEFGDRVNVYGKFDFGDKILKNAKNIGGDTWIAGSYNQGLTLKNGQQDSLVSSSSNLISQSWSLGLIQSNLLSKEDRFGIAFNQPLVVKSGSLNLSAPTGLDYDSGEMQYENRKISIAPTAIERNVEANYYVPTSEVSGLSLTGVYRMNPDNNDSNPSQKVVAVRWQSLF